MPCAVILTALPVEYLAVRAHLSDLQEEMHPQGTIYERGKFAANGQVWEVGIAEVGAGNAGAAVEAERAISHFKPDILFFVGIAGGIKDVAIGDVVAATKVYGYESGKVGEQFFTRPVLWHSAYALTQRARSEAKKEEWLQRLSNASTSKPNVYVAPIAAGEKVIASKESSIFNFIRASYNDAIAVEMEGFGFLSAAFAYPSVKAIVIRGISDLVEGGNEDSIETEKLRQRRAAHHASAFAFEILAKLDPRDETPYPSQESDELKQDWGDAPDISIFFGRTNELETLTQWISLNACRLVVIVGIRGVGKTRLSIRLGQGDIGTSGIGKTDLSLKLAKGIEKEFDYVIWRSLRDAPPITKILLETIKFLSKNQVIDTVGSVNDQISRLLSYLRKHRCLLIFDNVESILQGGNLAGQYLNEHENYGLLFEQIAEVPHKSCLILTSREKPHNLERLAGKTKPVRFLELGGLNYDAGKSLFEDYGSFDGSDAEWKKLIDFYNGNPLALQLAAKYIGEAFQGKIARFFKIGQLIFDDMRQDLLDWHFQRLSDLEKELMYWLAINREPVSIDQLREDTFSLRSKEQLPSTIQSLQRRLPLERTELGFTLQPVLMEYITTRFVEQICEEIISGDIVLFNEFSIVKALAKDYIRESQIRVFSKAIAGKLTSIFESQSRLETRLNQIIVSLREDPSRRVGYASGNVINLLSYLKIDLRGYDFSFLSVWQAYFQKVNLFDVNFSYADLTNSVFSQNFRSIMSVAFSQNGELLATGDSRGEIRVWQVENGQPNWIVHGHSKGIRAIAISPDGNLIASASFDRDIKLWNTLTGEEFKVLQGHRDLVRGVAFSPDGAILASCSDDCDVRLWNVQTGECIRTLQGHTNWVRSVAFSPGGQIIASCSEDRTVRLWSTTNYENISILLGHANRVHSVAFSPDGNILASGSDDMDVRLWNVQTRESIRTLAANTAGVWSVAFSPDGKTLAAGSEDQHIRIWDSQTGDCLKILLGHLNGIRSVVFNSTGEILASGSEDQTVKLWDIRTSECIKTWQGCTNRVWSVAFSPDGKTLASGNEDKTITFWRVETGECLRAIPAHENLVCSVAFSPDGKRLVSGSFDHYAKLWDVYTGRCLRVFEGHNGAVWSVDFNPDGRSVATSGYDETVRLWDVRTSQCFRTFPGHPNGEDRVAFSSDGQLLAIGGDDQTVKVWDARTGELIRSFAGHTNGLLALSFSPDGTLVASSGHDQAVKLWSLQTGQCLRSLEEHTKTVLSLAFSPNSQTLASVGDDQVVKLWNVQTGECIKSLEGHTHVLRTVAFSPDGLILASGGEDETIRLWDVITGECLRILTTLRPYQGMNITGVTGLTEAQKMTLRALGAFD